VDGAHGGMPVTPVVWVDEGPEIPVERLSLRLLVGEAQLFECRDVPDHNKRPVSPGCSDIEPSIVFEPSSKGGAEPSPPRLCAAEADENHVAFLTLDLVDGVDHSEIEPLKAWALSNSVLYQTALCPVEAENTDRQ